MVFFRLSKAGYGTVDQIERWDVRKVLQALHYEGFLYDFENAFFHLAKDEA